ncbi:MAG: inositol monophosphatase [Anaerolineae bacterium]|nr:inositol monophosphatase [Anaerolineae bacterium]
MTLSITTGVLIQADRWLATAQRIALEAGALMRKQWRQTHTIRSKGYRDIVTETDLAVEQLVIERLKASYPDHAITSEESGAEDSAASIRWLLDPVDGTTNFARSNPNFCITMAAIEGESPVAGVVYDPLRDHLFSARRGGGATLNGKRIQTRDTTQIAEVMFAVDWPRNPAARREMWQYAGKLIEQARTLRALGSAALNIVYVAPGWFDLYMARSLHAWDQTGAAVIAMEAGAVLGTLSGAPWTPSSPDPVVAATPALLEAFYTLQEGI